MATETADDNSTLLPMTLFDLDPSSDDIDPNTEPTVAFFHVTFLIFLMIGCLLGNSLVVVAIVTHRKLRRPCNVFIGGLAVADIEFTVCHVVAIDAAIYGEWRFTEALCVCNSLIIVATAVLSLFHMATIALNRYLYLCHQTTFPWLFTWRSSWIQEVVTYIAAILVAVVPGIFLANGVYDERLKTCSFSTREKGEWVYPLYLTVTVIFTCPVVSIVCYSKIYKRVNEVKMKVKSHNATAGTTNQSETREKRKMAIAKYMMKQMKSRFLVFLIFVLMFAPFAILSMLDPFVTLPPTLYLVSALILCTNTMVNPIIYGLYNKGFRDAYKSILGRFRLSRRKRQVGPSTPAEAPVIIPKAINENERQVGRAADTSGNRAINQAASDNRGSYPPGDNGEIDHHNKVGNDVGARSSSSDIGEADGICQCCTACKQRGIMGENELLPDDFFCECKERCKCVYLMDNGKVNEENEEIDERSKTNGLTTTDIFNVDLANGKGKSDISSHSKSRRYRRGSDPLAYEFLPSAANRRRSNSFHFLTEDFDETSLTLPTSIFEPSEMSDSDYSSFYASKSTWE